MGKEASLGKMIRGNHTVRPLDITVPWQDVEKLGGCGGVFKPRGGITSARETRLHIQVK